MLFGGLQKLTTLDFPGVVSALVFTQGCNFHCPYCHNAQLIPLQPDENADPNPQADDILAFLRKRADVLDGLVISGGEPCLHQDIGDFCREVKRLGYAIKLDTNGSFPERLERLLTADCLDYVAVDLKTAPDDYSPALCLDRNAGKKLLQSLALLAASTIPHEVRTTCVAPFVTPDSVKTMTASCGNRVPWLLQKAFLEENTTLQALTGEKMSDLLPIDQRLMLRN